MSQNIALYSEQSVLGSLLLNPKAFDDVADILTEGDFVNHDHKVIWKTIAGMASRGEYVDIVTVDEKLKSIGSSICISYLGEIASSTPTYKNIIGYAKAVSEKRIERELAEAAMEILDIANDFDPNGSSGKLDKAQQIVMGLSEKASSSAEPVAMVDVLQDVLTAIEGRMENGGAVSGLKTGMEELDRLTSGLQKGDLVIVAGRPSMGKTSFCMNIAEHVAIHEKKVALVFSMEMAKQQVTERSVANIGNVSLKAIRSGQLTDDDWSGVTVAVSKIQGAKLLVDDSCNLSVAQMRSKARKLKRKHGGLDLIVIDYLQLMGGTGKSRNEDLGEITRGIKLMARELDCPVILLSQLSRKCEERTDKRPMMSDLRDSGAIEQDADVVVMMYRHEYYAPESEQSRGVAEAIIRKQRMGELGTVYLSFQGQYSRFRDLDIGSASAYRNTTEEKNTPKLTRGFV